MGVYLLVRVNFGACPSLHDVGDDECSVVRLGGDHLTPVDDPDPFDSGIESDAGDLLSGVCARAVQHVVEK